MTTDLSVDDVGRILYAYGCLDYWDERALRGLVPRGGVSFDVGAHIGYYSLLLSRLVGVAGRVMSFEPVPYTYSFLAHNLRRNGAANVLARQVAVGVQEGWVRMSPARGGRLGWSTVDDTGDLESPCTTLDAEADRAGLERVDFVKLDVEGYEMQALSGARGVLQRFRPTVMFELNAGALAGHGASEAALMSFFEGLGYKLFRAGRRGLRPAAEVPRGSTYCNVFAVAEA